MGCVWAYATGQASNLYSNVHYCLRLRFIAAAFAAFAALRLARPASVLRTLAASSSGVSRFTAVRQTMLARRLTATFELQVATSAAGAPEGLPRWSALAPAGAD